jgi:hypothetical protein
VSVDELNCPGSLTIEPLAVEEEVDDGRFFSFPAGLFLGKTTRKFFIVTVMPRPWFRGGRESKKHQ